MSHLYVSPWWRQLSCLVLLALLSACSRDSAVPLEPSGPSTGKASGTGPTVSSVDPAYGEQGAVRLKVRVHGSGFTRDSKATWERNGVSDSKVQTDTTLYISSTELDAEITIASDADLDLYDVAVTVLGTGKKGIGMEMFEVKLRGGTDSDSRSVFEYFEVTSDGQQTALRGDGRTSSGSPVGSGNPSGYLGDKCGVHSKIFWENASLSPSGDAVVDPAKSWASLTQADKDACGGSERAITVNLGGTLGTRNAWFMNVRQAMQLADSVEAGTNTLGYRLQNFRISVSNERKCEYLRYGDTIGAQIKVTFAGRDVSGRRTWLAESQPSGDGKHYAGCESYTRGKYTWDGVKREVPFKIGITEVPFSPTGPTI